MPQKTNLNVSPYYDDFDANNQFYKVLFKPGFPVQSRELTTLQSILQGQIESFGKNIFKEGSMVIPGGITYNPNFYAAKLNSINSNIDVSVYIKKLIGKKITGLTSGITATVDFVALPGDPNIDDITIYVKYINSDSNNNFSPFNDGESLSCSENIVYGNTTINAGSPFASLINSNATFVGSSVSIADGIYFIRGHFLKVSSETILLDEYDNVPSYRVGLKVSEALVGTKDDSSLYDNAKGFSNYAAPGADRLKIDLSLVKKDLTDLDDVDFIELLRVDNGAIKKIKEKTDYNIIRDYLAQRTYEESGNYSVEPFDVSLNNSLNDNLGSGGLFAQNQKTDDLNDPTDNLMCVTVSPGKAYVKGYDVENTVSKILDVEKPRETKKVNSTNIPFSIGNILRVNNVSGTPEQTKVVNFHSRHNGLGVGIGSARVYTFNNTDASYQGANTNWDLYLYDVQTYTRIILNNSVTDFELPKTSLVKGKSTSASGYAVNSGGPGVNEIILTQTSGRFSVGEQISINGIDISRSIERVIPYGIQDIKSVTRSGTGAYAFKADTYLESFPLLNNVVVGNIESSSWDSGTLTSPGGTFSGIKTDTIIRYRNTSVGFKTETFNRVSSVSLDGLTVTLAGIDTVDGVFDGSVSSGSNLEIKIGSPILRNKNEATLYHVLPNKNISSLDLSNSNLSIRSQSDSRQSDSDGNLIVGTQHFSSLTGITTLAFSAFSADRYSLHNSDVGQFIGTITSDSFDLDNNTITFRGLSDQDNYILNATLRKSGIQSKKKIYNRSKELIVSLSRLSQSGSTENSSINDGLTYNNCYGLRVQDEEISLNYADVSKVIAVYESLDSGNVSLDKITCSAVSNITDNSIVGENIISTSTNTVARFVKSPSANQAEIVYLNNGRFKQGEEILFEESNITTNINSIDLGKYKDITNNFILDKAQRDQYYDYSRLIRNSDSPIPSKKLLIIFDYYSVNSNDNGDVFTVLSYDKERYNEDIPEIGVNRIRATDTLDFRPRVVDFSGNDKSPFDFDSREFSSNTRILAPNENSFVGYEYYLGRIDKIFIDKLGTVGILKGVSSINPTSPIASADAMEIAEIILPPYLFNTQDAKISLIDNKRYTMRDIGLIETRVENLEEVTTLSLLEINTQSLQIKDAENRDRFKSGFFVDDFKNNSLINQDFSTILIDGDKKEMSPFITRRSIKSIPAFSGTSNLNPDSFDINNTNLKLLDSNVKKTGNSITLNYNEVEWIKQGIGTTIENVNPYHVVAYNGDVELTPPQDVWTDVQTFVSNFSTGSTNIVGGRNFAVFSNTSRSSNLTITNSLQRYMRTRNTMFSARNLKPYTRYYQFIDSRSDIDIIPQLLEVESVEGQFIVGETVTAYEIDNDGNSIERGKFRLSKSNAKYGPHNSPDTVYEFDPYQYPNESRVPENYTSGSTILNIDVESLSRREQGRYYGYVKKGFIIEGASASAYVKDIRLIADSFGDLKGAFFIRNPNRFPELAVENGSKTYRLTNSSINKKPSILGKLDTLISSAQTTYFTRGITQTNFIVNITTTQTTVVMGYVDPLAQTFTVGGNIDAPSAIGRNDDENGIFLTSVNLYFENVDSENKPIKVELRTVELGIPTRKKIGNSVILTPKEFVNENGEVVEKEIIKTSTDGTQATNIKFPEPIYLAPGEEYALVVISEYSEQYRLWTARMGEKNVLQKNLPDANAGVYSRQYAFGSLYKSQNGSIWTADQNQDLKFDIFKAEFVSAGTAYFYNPQLDISNDGINILENNPLKSFSRSTRIGITTVLESQSNYHDVVGILTAGRKLSGATPGSVASIVGTASSVSGVGIETGGSNYGSSTSSNVGTFNIIGSGKNLKINIDSITNGKISGVSLANHGTGYNVGDVVGINTAETTNKIGRNAKIKITSTYGIDTLEINNIQGDINGASKAFRAGIGLSYFDNSGTLVSMATTQIIDASNGIISPKNEGNLLRVNHFNHGMYSSNNKVKLNGVKSSYTPTSLALDLLSTDVNEITLSSSSGFDVFEGIAVSSTNPGYVKIGREIIKYTEISAGNKLTNISRGIDNTAIVSHLITNPDGTSVTVPVYKYELNGISLRRINGISNSISSIDNDVSGYYVIIDRSSNGTDRSTDTNDFPQLSFTNDSQHGGNNVSASENIVYTEIIPNFPMILPNSSTTASGSVRTVTATSVDGTETSFVDVGYENIELNQINKLNSIRMVASEINETDKLTSLPSNKSLTTAIRLTSTNKNLSPQLFLTENCGTIHLNPVINNPITDYSSDSRVNSLLYDPHAAVYVSNEVTLKNPANSLKVLIAAYRHETADFRVLYRLNRADSSEVEQEFELFPGYDNLVFKNDSLSMVLDSSKNTGRPDTFVRPSLENEFLDYEFTANNLDLFNGYTIKIVMSGSNSAHYPKFKDLRTIAIR